jgi:hypothetical protein
VQSNRAEKIVHNGNRLTVARRSDRARLFSPPAATASSATLAQLVALRQQQLTDFFGQLTIACSFHQAKSGLAHEHSDQ